MQPFLKQWRVAHNIATDGVPYKLPNSGKDSGALVAHTREFTKLLPYHDFTRLYLEHYLA